MATLPAAAPAAPPRYALRMWAFFAGYFLTRIRERFPRVQKDRAVEGPAALSLPAEKP